MTPNMLATCVMFLDFDGGVIPINNSAKSSYAGRKDCNSYEENYVP
jgi:hypothetical protein